MPTSNALPESGILPRHLPIIAALVESQADGVAVFDNERRVVIANPAMSSMTGLPREGFYLQELTRLFQEHHVKIDEKLNEAITKRKATSLEEISLVKFYYEMHISPLIGDDGGVIGGAVILHDITQFKELALAKAEIDRQKTQFETFLECIGDGVVAIDKDWRIVLWNRAAGHISGWDKAEVLGKPFREIVRFIRQRDQSENIAFISDAILKKEIRFMENHTNLIRKDGREIPVGDSAAPVYGTDGEVTGAIIIFRDVTAERDAQLLRSSFAYASHQLRTPVVKALWGLEAARDFTSKKKVRDHMDAAISAVKSIRKMTSAMLETADIDQGRVVPKFGKVGLADVIAAVVESVRKSAASHKIAVKVEPVNKVIGFRSDKKMLAKILHEVMNNAVMYGRKKGKVRVNASLTNGDVVIEVEDDGIGIAEEQQGIVFTKFFRGQNIPSESIGAGLGLFIAKSYAELLKGKIWFTSVEGKGSHFFIRLPIS
ncbi:PAS domain-containing sensor histidine kinase [Candidatus Uhrbacteria bacterium]|nr:PAS domain-containing sensor histidine kinase [Candidatus Uhrbacteria bacterium]